MVRSSEDSRSEVRLQGDLTGDSTLRRHVEHVRALMRPGRKAQRSDEIHIDLSGLTNMNTALLAALLALGRESRRSGVRLVISSAPELFRDQAATAGVEEALRRACRYEPKIDAKQSR